MHLDQRITAFSKLGNFLGKFCDNAPITEESLMLSSDFYTDFDSIIKQSRHYNAWFTEEQVRLALAGWAKNLSEEKLAGWLTDTDVNDKTETPLDVAVVMAGNLPLVGFHDFLCVLITGHRIVAKLSSNDKQLLPYLAKVLVAIEPEFKEMISFTQERLPHFDAVIATGSNNTARYFEYYFRDKPHIIRKNRNGVAVLNGTENMQELQELGKDLFTFYGLGCRSVSKLFVPKNYDFDLFFKAIYDFKEVVNHDKYANNYDYNKAVYLMGQEQLLDNNFVILKQDTGLSSPIAVIFYEYYASEQQLEKKLNMHRDKIQCIVASGFDESALPFGTAQQPELWDYADGINTIEFLSKLG